MWPLSKCKVRATVWVRGVQYTPWYWNESFKHISKIILIILHSSIKKTLIEDKQIITFKHSSLVKLVDIGCMIKLYVWSGACPVFIISRLVNFPWVNNETEYQLKVYVGRTTFPQARRSLVFRGSLNAKEGGLQTLQSGTYEGCYWRFGISIV